MDPDVSPAEGEWLDHEGPGPYAGWLRRYPDGTLVAEDGTVLEYADDEAEESVPEAERGQQDQVAEAGAPAPDGSVPSYLRWETSDTATGLATPLQ